MAYDPRDPRKPPRPFRTLPRDPREEPPEEDLSTEAELRRYIEHSRTSVRVASEERGAIRESVKNLSSQLGLYERRSDDRHAELKGMFKGHEARITALEKDQEDTGSWVRTHGGRLVREEKKRQWWTTRIAKLGFKVAEWAIIAALAWTLGHFVWR